MCATLVTKTHKSRTVASEAQKKQPHVLQLMTAGNVAANFLEPRITELGINLAQALILLAIRELLECQAGPTAIANHTGLKRPRITGHLHELENQKLIHAITPPGKKPRYALTATGIKVTSKIDLAVAEVDKLLKDILPVKEHEFLDHKMPRIVSDLQWVLTNGW
ncbi:MAG: MarR family winged helix-turn-helix transcriptional regulator [Burkholderiaceae bacterium]|nr:MarR family winged helix-turn-helix transcriptional regulator [Burkholderiaceae bacterium]